MKMRSAASLLILVLCHQITCTAQKSDEKILMTVAGRDVEAGEFIRMYNKGLDPASKTDLNTYLEQFTVFKLKVADALERGYDTTKAFRDELKGYRTQLAQNYLTDNSIKEKLLRKAWERS
ncbi:MAG: peptidylprolyl isomerase, partial [Bacteroidales bacterium]